MHLQAPASICLNVSTRFVLRFPTQSNQKINKSSSRHQQGQYPHILNFLKFIVEIARLDRLIDQMVYNVILPTKIFEHIFCSFLEHTSVDIQETEPTPSIKAWVGKRLLLNELICCCIHFCPWKLIDLEICHRNYVTNTHRISFTVAKKWSSSDISKHKV